jgi:hypothetical protein
MGASARWPPAAIFLGLWLLLGLAIALTYGYFAISAERDRLLHLCVATLGTFPIVAVWLEWKRKVFASGCLAICGIVLSFYGAVLILSVGEEFGRLFFAASIALLLFGAASVFVQILDWTFHR